MPYEATGILSSIDGIKQSKSIGAFDYGLFHEIEAGSSFSLKDITVSNMSVSHDANEPVAYRFCSNGKKIAVATDMGIFDDTVVEALSGMDAILLEANHDETMLLNNPHYSAFLKQRILSTRSI